MKRKIGLAAIVLAAPALGGCAVQAALAAAQLAQNVRMPEGPSNAHLRPAATEACTRQAEQHGSVHVIDVEQRRADRIIVWGSVTNAQQQRRAFQCHFTTKLASFKLGEILPAN